VLTVTTSRNFGPLADAELVTRDDWGAVGRLAREQIIRHTNAGVDEDGKPFAPYSPKYAEQKRKTGASSRPNLQVSGGMLGAITVEPDNDGVTLSFSR
jgi:hypothetical protein